MRNRVESTADALGLPLAEHHFEHLPCECSQCSPFNRSDAERHEFHMLDPWHAYCICGWTGNDRLLALDDSTAPAAFIGMLYRKHLE